MKLEQQCVSLPIAQRLKELGVKQEGLFMWMRDDKSDIIEWELRNMPHFTSQKRRHDNYVAFTVAELGEILPDWIFTMKRGESPFLCRDYLEYSTGHPYPDQLGDTEADARGKMLIYLIENGLIKLEK